MIYWMKTIMSLEEEWCQLSGQHQRYSYKLTNGCPKYSKILTFYRLSTTRSTPLPVMCGALDALCMRYGVSDTSRLKATIILRYNNIIANRFEHNNYGINDLGDQNDRQGLSSPSPSWINQRALQNHDSMLVCLKFPTDTMLKQACKS